MNDIFVQTSPSLLQLTSWQQQYRGLVAGFTTRLGGVSDEPFASNNMGLHVQDDEQAVLSNRQQLAATLGFDWTSLTCAEQVHGNKVAVVSASNVGSGRLSTDDTIKDADALVTDLPDALLVSFYADCVPLIFVDPTKEVVGLAHAGWKGTVGAIAVNTIKTMEQHYGCKLEQIKVAIGPSISDCCYEVDTPVISAVMQLFEQFELEHAIREQCMKIINEQKAYINLKEINRQIMIKEGILSSHIELSKLCTGCSTDMFYSHRMESGKTGRMASFIGWQKGNKKDDSTASTSSYKTANT